MHNTTIIHSIDQIYKRDVLTKVCLFCNQEFTTGNTVRTGKNRKCCTKICAQKNNGRIYAKKYTWTRDQFLIEARKKHGHKFDYSLTIYKTQHEYIKIICPKHGIFQQKAGEHLRYGCQSCAFEINKPVSKVESSWIRSLGNKDIITQAPIILESKTIYVDGYDPHTNTVYEFYGDYWHGNPKRFAADYYNQQAKKTCGQLYTETVERSKVIIDGGYNLVIMWEYDYVPNSFPKT